MRMECQMFQIGARPTKRRRKGLIKTLMSALKFPTPRSRVPPLSFHLLHPAAMFSSTTPKQYAGHCGSVIYFPEQRLHTSAVFCASVIRLSDHFRKRKLGVHYRSAPFGTSCSCLLTPVYLNMLRRWTYQVPGCSLYLVFH
jgi:hypothetical protein